jgi:DNA repair protein RadC
MARSGLEWGRVEEGDAELVEKRGLAALVGLGVPSSRARRILETTPLTRLTGLSEHELVGMGITAAAAKRLRAAGDLATTFGLDIMPPGEPLTSPEAVAHRMRFLSALEQEEFWGLALDNKSRLRYAYQVTRGTVNASLVHPRETFRPALLASATSIIVVHNHPSGEPLPSPEDRAVTERLEQAGVLLGVKVLDHVIVAGMRYYSFHSGHGELRTRRNPEIEGATVDVNRPPVYGRNPRPLRWRR